MRLRITALLLVLLLAVPLLFACGKNEEKSDPMKVAEKYLNALKDSDIKTAISVNFCRADVKELADAYGRYWELEAEEDWDEFVAYLSETFGTESLGEAAVKLMETESEQSRASYADYFGDDYVITISDVQKGDAADEETIEDYVQDHNADIDAAIESLNAVSNSLGTDLLGEYRIGDGAVKEGIYVTYKATINGSLAEEERVENGKLLLLNVDGEWYVANNYLSPIAVAEQIYYDWQFDRTYAK